MVQVSLPKPRGMLSEYVLGVLLGRQEAMAPTSHAIRGCDVVDDDLQLALYLAYELHYAGLPGVPDSLEWDVRLLSFRQRLEQHFEDRLRDLVPPAPDVSPRALVPALIEAVGGPSMSLHVRDRATVTELREFVTHRSAYQLKEADPHTWAIPRLTGRSKQHLARIQAGEYGTEDDDHIVHAELYAGTMRSLGLDERRHAHLDALPGVSLAVSNLASFLGLHRRLRGSLVGHLTLSETTSVEAMRNYVAGLQRLAVPADALRFYEVHVLADEHHGVMALDMLSELIEEDDRLFADAAFGIAAALIVERSFARHLLERWEAGKSSLRPLAA